MTTGINHSHDGRHHTGAMERCAGPDPEVPERAKGPRRFPAACNPGFLPSTRHTPRAGKVALLRWEGLDSSLITEWRRQRDRGAEQALALPAGRQSADPRGS